MAPVTPKGASPNGQRSEGNPATTVSDASDQLRSQPPRFLQRLVHEVRSPAHAIHISLSILSESLKGVEIPSEAQEALALLGGTSDELRCTLRSLSRFAHTLDEIQLSPLKVKARISAVWEKLAASHQGSKPTFSNSAEDFALVGDDRMFDLAVECILDNSLKFASPERPLEISVTSESTDDGHLLRFQDNGIGIEEEYLAKCYEPFERLFPRTVYPGAGLGIPTASTCLKHMSGEVELTPLPEGALASFRFSN
ncbi:MAG: hypothetical protein Aurels2KO_49380 [Aureliella sp.]